MSEQNRRDFLAATGAAAAGALALNAASYQRVHGAMERVGVAFLGVGVALLQLPAASPPADKEPPRAAAAEDRAKPTARDSVAYGGRVLGPDGRPQYTVAQMLTGLGVSSSGYYEWRRRPQSATAARREKLKQLITVIFELSD